MMDFQELNAIYNEETPYGCWITDDGSIIDCPEYCSHSHYVRLSYAWEKGFVSIVYGKRHKGVSDRVCVRFDIELTNNKTYKSLIRKIRKLKDEIYDISHLSSDNYKGMSQITFSKSEVIEFFKLVANGKIKLYDRWDNSKEANDFNNKITIKDTARTFIDKLTKEEK